MDLIVEAGTREVAPSVFKGYLKVLDGEKNMHDALTNNAGLGATVYTFHDKGAYGSAAQHTFGEWSHTPDDGTPGITTFQDTAGDIKTFMKGWLLVPTVQELGYLEITDVDTSLDKVVVKGDADWLSGLGQRYWLIAPAGVDPATGALETDPCKMGSLWLWAGYHYRAPILGFHTPPGQSAGTYGAQTGNNRLGSYQCWNRIYEPSTGRWTTPDPAASPWTTLFEYSGSAPIGISDPAGLEPQHPGKPPTHLPAGLARDMAMVEWWLQAREWQNELIRRQVLKDAQDQERWDRLAKEARREQGWAHQESTYLNGLNALRRLSLALTDRCQKCCPNSTNCNDGEGCTPLECHFEGRQAANAIVRAWQNWFGLPGKWIKSVNDGTGQPDPTRVGGYHCYDWVRIFYNALDAANLECLTFKEVKWWYEGFDRTSKRNKVHYWLEIHVCGNDSEECIVRVDDGFFSDGYVHDGSWPSNADSDVYDVGDTRSPSRNSVTQIPKGATKPND